MFLIISKMENLVFHSLIQLGKVYGSRCFVTAHAVTEDY